MRNHPCDPEALAAYLEGTLDDRGCARVEEHARRCERCAKAIGNSLEPFAKTLRDKLSPNPIPRGVENRIAVVATERSGQKMARPWKLMPAGVVAIVVLLAWVFWNRAPAIQVQRMGGMLVLNGRVMAGSEDLPNDSLVSAIGPSEIQLAGLTLRTDGAWTQLHLLRSWRKWHIRVLAGTVTFIDRKGAPNYVALVDNKEVAPVGTAFDLTAAAASGQPSVRVFDNSVSVKWDGRQEEYHAGSQIVGSETKVIGDDPMALERQKPRLVSKLEAALDRTKPLPGTPPLPPEAVSALTAAQVEAHRSPQNPAPILATALILTRQMEVQSASGAIRRALELDPKLSEASTEDLWELMRGQSCSINRELSATLVAILAARQAADNEYLQAWADFLATPAGLDDGPELEAAAVRLWTFRRAADRWTAAWAFQAAGQRLNSKVEDLQTSARICKSLLADPTLVLNRRQKANVHAVLAEALFFQKPERPRSLVELRRAVSLWPRPAWRVNLACRTVEVDKPTPEVFRMMAEGLLAQPSPTTYERALMFLEMTAHSERDWIEIRDLAKWLAKTYAIVPDALRMAADCITMFDRRDAVVLYKKSRDLRRNCGEGWPMLERCRSAALEWQLAGKRFSGDRRETVDFARSHGIPGPNSDEQYVEVFYTNVGDHESAADCLAAQVSGSELDPHHTNLTIVFELLRSNRHADALRLLDEEWSDQLKASDPYAYTWMGVLAAEMLEGTDPARARAIVKETLDKGVASIKAGWPKVQHADLQFEARLRWLLGQKEKAIALQQEFLNSWSVLAIREEELARLARWKAEARP